MLKTEKKAALSLSLVYALRMLGLFMILPVFSLYAHQYSAASPLLIGLAIGIYGLTQGLFQLPFGILSDRFGRKKMIIIGLVIFCAGSVVAALADSIYQVIAGRALQGLGAIAAVVMALAADLTREQVRLRIMAMIGMSIGFSFMLSMVMGPLIAANFGLAMLFWITAALALLGMLVIWLMTPQPQQQSFHRDAQLALPDVGKILANRELLKLDAGVFMLHLVLSATFVVFPLMLKGELGVEAALHWKTYLPVFVLSVLLMVPMIVIAEKFKRSRALFLFAIALLIVSELGLALGNSYLAAFIMLVLFFTAFNFLEAVLPSTVASIAPADMKGTAMGLFSSAQFFGAFSGGVLGGWLLATASYSVTFMVLGLLLFAWLLLAWSMQSSTPLASRVVSLQGLEAEQVKAFLVQAAEIDGVHEVSVYAADEVAYLKVERGFDQSGLDALLSAGAKQPAAG